MIMRVNILIIVIMIITISTIIIIITVFSSFMSSTVALPGGQKPEGLDATYAPNVLSIAWKCAHASGLALQLFSLIWPQTTRTFPCTCTILHSARAKGFLNLPVVRVSAINRLSLRATFSLYEESSAAQFPSAMATRAISASKVSAFLFKFVRGVEGQKL
jgi:hypothetical protein